MWLDDEDDDRLFSLLAVETELQGGHNLQILLHYAYIELF